MLENYSDTIRIHTCFIHRYFFLLILLFTQFMKLHAESKIDSTIQNQPWSIRMAESIMSRNPNGYGNWDYVTGTVLKGFEELWRKTGSEL